MIYVWVKKRHFYTYMFGSKKTFLYPINYIIFQLLSDKVKKVLANWPSLFIFFNYNNNNKTSYNILYTYAAFSYPPFSYVQLLHKA